MPDWKIRRAPTIQTELEVPGDKSISHRAVMLASLSNGTCVVKGFLPSEDCLCTVAAMRALGVEIENADATTLIVHGKRRVFKAPANEYRVGMSVPQRRPTGAGYYCGLQSRLGAIRRIRLRG